MTDTLAVGDAVLTPDDRVGMIAELYSNSVVIQFGADGPFQGYTMSALRRATATEIRAAGLEGVGFNEPRE